MSNYLAVTVDLTILTTRNISSYFSMVDTLLQALFSFGGDDDDDGYGGGGGSDDDEDDDMDFSDEEGDDMFGDDEESSNFDDLGIVA